MIYQFRKKSLHFVSEVFFYAPKEKISDHSYTVAVAESRGMPILMFVTSSGGSSPFSAVFFRFPVINRGELISGRFETPRGQRPRKGER